ncbi:signal transduction histidine kinase [Kribbella orskensis]|uniref:Signal transduction histidine kinase n=2 Tax=Kribbellaceae TaxID=2726069 RepID=A0ABY2BFI4_9ACTN|nr:signal transduction histidine kinase [Kribbella sp. VKM Ac-2500]TCO18790.1 signal transduction histidine kinase [Kribbella orskensis]
MAARGIGTLGGMNAARHDAGRDRGDSADLLLPLWRALVVFRVITYGFAVFGVWTRWDGIRNPAGAVIQLAVMGVWTVIASIGYSRHWGRRNTRLAVADLIVTIGCMYLTLLAQPLVDIRGGASVLTSVWAAGPVLALAISRGRDGGLLGATAVSLALLSLRGFDNVSKVLSNVQLLLVAGLVVGYAATTMRRANARLREAIATESATAERLRLGRSIHDGVLQVLAQVQRRGTAIGGEAVELAALAAEQEVALRNLMASRPISGDRGRIDLCMLLLPLATPRVDVVVPAEQVLLPTATATELVAAVKEALSNVDKHAGPEARCWVVVEDLGGEVLLSVRDDGSGTTPDQLLRAGSDGHLGVSQSIRGRITDLGGSVTVRTAPGEGTEWEMKVTTA